MCSRTDSIGVGEDGATHEPVEQLAGLRAIPDLQVIRPADGKENHRRLADRHHLRPAHLPGAYPPEPAAV